MTITKNETLWLASGIAGENQARALNLPIEFTRLEVGDANGNPAPPMDSALTALINKVMEGAIISHDVDQNDNTQRIIEMSIPPTHNFNAVEMLLFAKHGTTEFPHSYIKLAAPSPIRTIENGGAQIKVRMTVRVSQYTDFKISVSPNLQYVTHDELNGSYGPIDVGGDIEAIINKDKLHTFTGHAVLTIPDGDGTFYVKVDPSVDLKAGNCDIKRPGATPEKIRVDGALVDVARITKTNRIYEFTKRNGEWLAWS